MPLIKVMKSICDVCKKPLEGSYITDKEGIYCLECFVKKCTRGVR